MTDFVISDRGDRTEMVVTGKWTTDAEAALELGRVDRLVLNYALGFCEPTLDFLRGAPVRQLEIVDPRLDSLEPIYSLAPKLSFLHLATDPRLAVDVAAFTELVDLSADWAQVGTSVGAASRLRRLLLTNYRQPDLAPVATLRELLCLTLKDRPQLHSLSGLPALSELRIFGAKGLADITGLRDHQSIRELELEGCRKISHLDDLSGCASLEFLNISECGDVASLSPMGSLSGLRFFYAYGSTKILDGDLGPVASLPLLRELRMQSRRQYRPSVAQIQAGLPES